MHLQCIRCLLPWMFAYDRVHYSRYLSLYWCDMQQLPEVCPEAHSLLQGGEFAVQHGTNAFAQVPVDMAIEQTVNKDTKISGGIIGKSLKPRAVKRWMLTAHDRAATTAACEVLAGQRQAAHTSHKESKGMRSVRDENDVNNVIRTIEACAVSPIMPSTSCDLVNITTGAVAPPDVQSDIAHAFKRGDNAFRKFVQERLVSGTVSFHSKLESLKLKSFASLVKSAKVSVQDREVSVRADRNLFARLLVISQSRHTDLRHVLSFPLGPLPLALATPQGTLCKTTKAKLLPLLESSTTAEANEPSASSRTAVILDGMAILPSLSSPGPTFGDLAASVLTSILSVHSAVNSARYRVDFVVDTYPAISIKSCERQSRSLSGAVRMRITKCDQRCGTSLWHALPTRQSLLTFWQKNGNTRSMPLSSGELYFMFVMAVLATDWFQKMDIRFTILVYQS